MSTHASFSLEGRVALVTGATSGLGGAMAEALAAAGADVVCHGLVEPPEETMAAVRALGRRAAAVVGDLSLPATALRLVGEAEAALGPVDVLVNNAGTIRRAPAAEHSDEDWDLVLAVDLSSPFRLSREVGKRLIARGARGKIVNVASINGMRGKFGLSNYAASKAGIIGLTKAVATELARYHVNVNAVAPGLIATPLVMSMTPEALAKSKSEILLGEPGQPEDVAHTIVFLCSDLTKHITGEIIKIDGGQYI